jgi:hypothetical protein
VEEAIVCHRGSSLAGGEDVVDGTSRDAGVGGGRGRPRPGRHRRLDSSAVLRMLRNHLNQSPPL